MDPVRIPEEVLKAARVKMSRRVGAMIVTAMAETGHDYDTIGVRIGKPPEFVKKIIYKFVNGEGGSVHDLSDICFAMGFMVRFSLKRGNPAAT